MPDDAYVIQAPFPIDANVVLKVEPRFRSINDEPTKSSAPTTDQNIVLLKSSSSSCLAFFSWRKLKHGAALSYFIWFLCYSINKRNLRVSGAFHRDAEMAVTTTQARETQNGFHSPIFSVEILYSLIGSIVLELILYLFAHPIIEHWYMNNLDATMDEKLRVATALKASLTVNQLIKSTILTVWGFYVLTDSPYCPRLLGGTGTSDNFFAQLPHFDTYGTHQYFYPCVFFRYVIEIVYFPLRKRILPKDYKVLCVHHFVTIKLILGSYFMNYGNIGALVMHLHNISEPLLCLCRLTNNVPLFDQFQLDVIFWGLMTASWGYLRLIVWPLEFVRPLYREIRDLSFGNSMNAIHYFDPFESGHYVCISWSLVAFFILQIMHAFWFLIFLKIARNAIFRGVKSDAISDPPVKPK